MALPGELPFSRGDRVSRLGCVSRKPHLRDRGATILSPGIPAAATRATPTPPAPSWPPAAAQSTG